MRIRINTDVQFIWKLLMEGEEVDWRSYDLALEIMTPSHNKERVRFSVNGSELTFKYKPKQIGQYFLSAFINRYKEDEQALDVKLFEGVRWSFLQENEDEDLLVETINLSGDIREGHVDLKRYYTKDEIDFNFYTKEEIEAKEYLQSIPEEYVTEEELRDKAYVSRAELEAKKYLTYIPSDYVTEAKLASKKYLTSVPSEYVTEDELAAKNYATKSDLNTATQNLDSYYTKDEINQKNFITQSYLEAQNYLTVIPDNYVTANQLAAKGYLTTIPDNYITESELKAKGYLTAVPSEYITASQLEAKGYLKSIPSEYVTETELAYKNYATKPELNVLSNKLDRYYTKDEIESKDYVTLTYLMSRGFLTAVPSIYVTETELNTAISSSNRNFENALLDFYTKEQIDSLFANIPQDVIDLSDYYTKYEVQSLIDKVNAKEVDLTGYYTKEEIDSKNFLQRIPDDYVTELELAYKNYARLEDVNAVRQTLYESYYSKEDIEAKRYITKDYIDGKGYLTTVPENYVTAEELDARKFLTAVPSEYVTESELESIGYLKSVPSEYVTESELDAKGYLTAVPSEYVTESELTARDYATKSEVNVLGEILDRYYTKEQINDKGYLTSDMLAAKGYLTAVPAEYVTETELAYKNYATKSDILNVESLLDSYYSKTEIDGKNYLTSSILNDYYKKSEVDDKIYTTITNLTGYYTKDQADNKFYSKEEIDAKGYLTVVPPEYITETELGLQDFATKSYVIFLINQRLEGNILPANYYTKDEVNKLLDNLVIDEDTNIELNNYYTKAEVDELLENVDSSEDVDLSNYYTAAEVDDMFVDWSADVTKDYYTKAEVDEMMQNSGSTVPPQDKPFDPTVLEDYYTKSEVNQLIDDIRIPEADLSNYYTKGQVDNLMDNIDFPEPDLSNYYTKGQVDQMMDNIDLSDYYTKGQVDTIIDELDIPDVSNYYTKSEVDSLVDKVEDQIKDVSAEMITGSGIKSIVVMTEAEYQELSYVDDKILYILI